MVLVQIKLVKFVARVKNHYFRKFGLSDQLLEVTAG